MSDQTKKKDKTAKKPKATQPAQPVAGNALQQMQPLFNQAIFHKGNKKLDMSGNLRDTNAPTGLDWLSKFGPNRPEVAERKLALGRDGDINARAAKGREAVAAMKFLQGRGNEPEKTAQLPAIQPEFVGPAQPRQAQPQILNPNALVPTFERGAENLKRNTKGFWDSFVTGEGPAMPAVSLVKAFNPLLGPTVSAAPAAMKDPMTTAKRVLETFVPTVRLFEPGVKAGTDWLSRLFMPNQSNAVTEAGLLSQPPKIPSVASRPGQITSALR
jgi:hypothetical protein